MSSSGIFITSMGIISPVGRGISDTVDAVRKDLQGIKPLRLFPVGHTPPLPVGEIDSFSFADDVPRTHALALIAAEEAMKNSKGAPDAVVIGVTTGGMLLTEELLKRGEADFKRYSYHSTGSVAEYIARHVGCKGPVLTVSTACSSGIVALKIAFEMLRRGKAKRVLAGGADALCRLTYYGFHSLQLVDPMGARPFDRNRRGMTVGEGAAMLMLSAAEDPPGDAIAELLGVGLSCDAHHPASPHPKGLGALRAMERALSDAGILAKEIDYIHLHGTGTIDNDIAEAKAICSLFGEHPLPPLSSIKGSVGHSLAAAGAIGAVASVLSIAHGVIPATVGFNDADPGLNIVPVKAPMETDVNTALVNSFGFGGNNAVLVLGHPETRRSAETLPRLAEPVSFSVLGTACLTAAGNAEKTIERMRSGDQLQGIVPSSDVLKPLSEKAVRRLKRFPRMVLNLAISAREGNPTADSPASVFLGTGWGGLSETYDFITKLFTSDEQFSSPTDFIGSVHNAAAGQVAIHFKSTGPNVTMTGGDCAFEQALISASLIAGLGDDPLLVIGADEYHETLSPLFDPSAALTGMHSDGGGALYLKPALPTSPLRISPTFMAYSHDHKQIIPSLIRELGGSERIKEQFGAILAGIPAAQRRQGKEQMDDFLSVTGYHRPVIDYRQHLGEFASASAVAAVLGVSFVQTGEIPGGTFQQERLPLHGCGVLVVGFGKFITAVEILP